MSSGKVAIIGGGISGLSCAKHLAKIGIESTVFDTGKNFAGGRCSSRVLEMDGQKIVMDHSAQFFTANDVLFKEWCDHHTDYLHQWEGPIHVVQSNIPADPLFDLPARYVGKHGMRSLTEALSQDLDIKIGRWVSNIEKKNGKWELREHGKSLGIYDTVVIAHNGKCADRLLSTANVPRIHDLLKVTFGSKLPEVRNMRKMHLSSLYAMVFVLSEPLDLPFEGAYVKDTKNILSWICNTSAKIGQQVPSGTSTSSSKKEKVTKSFQSWTLISTREYATSNKVPQEAIPNEKEIQIKEDLFSAFSELIGIPKSFLKIEYSKIQLWGAAIPLNRHTAPCILDSNEHIGICGDWFHSSPSVAVSSPCIESAWSSGRILAEGIGREFSSSTSTSSSTLYQDIGLNPAECFEACDHSHPLGNVPGFISTAAAATVPRTQTKGPYLTAKMPSSVLKSESEGRSDSKYSTTDSKSPVKKYIPQKNSEQSANSKASK